MLCQKKYASESDYNFPIHHLQKNSTHGQQMLPHNKMIVDLMFNICWPKLEIMSHMVYIFRVNTSTELFVYGVITQLWFRQHLLTKINILVNTWIIFSFFRKYVLMNQNEHHGTTRKIFPLTNIICNINFHFRFWKKMRNMKRPLFSKKLFFQPSIIFHENDLVSNFLYQINCLVL